MRYTRTKLTALLLLVACGDASQPALDPGVGPDEPSPDDPPAMPADAGERGEAEAVRLDGVYSVPVDDPSLAPYASQPVVLDWRDGNDQIRLDYDFPTDLTGVSQRVSFDGVRAADGTIELQGELGSATCEPSAPAGTIVCTERFPLMTFDLERLQRDLERRGLTTEEIARRLEVAALFQSDPIGILEFAVE